MLQYDERNEIYPLQNLPPSGPDSLDYISERQSQHVDHIPTPEAMKLSCNTS